MHKIRFPLGLRHRPAGGAYSAPSDSLTVFKGATSKAREEEDGDGMGRGGKWKGKGRGEKKDGRGMERRGSPPPQKKNIFRPRTAPASKYSSFGIHAMHIVLGLQ